jgi:D-beta-D-heptose 7-phosphate kinase/D-beta-D-heptose 1-phosphate adenosyltransferase
VAGTQILARFDQGSTCPVDRKTERSIIARLTNLFPRCDAVIVSDYDYGVLTPRVIDTLARLQARHPRVLVVDSKRLPAYRHARPTAVKPNHDEAVKLLGSGVFAGFQSRADGIAAEGERLLDISGARLVAVTLDTEGAIIIERDGPPYRTYAQPVVNARTVGAGDTFTGALALALAAGARPHIAAELASTAAHIVVSKDGTAACSAEELRHRILTAGKLVTDPSVLASRLESHRRRGHRIVLTSGCFDALHPGHVTFLNRAKALGDLLIVGVTSSQKLDDEPGSKIQNPDPLAALSCIDHLIPFDQGTAANLIRAIRPDVFVQGGEYSVEDLPEAQVVQEVGGVVRILPYAYEGPYGGDARPVPEVSAFPVAPRHAGDTGPDAIERPRKPFVVVANDQAYA